MLNDPTLDSIQEIANKYVTQQISSNPLCKIERSTFDKLLADKFLLVEVSRGNLDKSKNKRVVEADQFITVSYESNDRQFQLKAAVVHLGDTITSGHYVCAAWNKSCLWVLYNDENVSCYTFNELMANSYVDVNKNGVLFLYQMLEP